MINCTTSLQQFPTLLNFLAFQLPTRTFIIHSDPIFVLTVNKIISFNEKFSFSWQKHGSFMSKTAPANTVDVYFSADNIPSKNFQDPGDFRYILYVNSDCGGKLEDNKISKNLLIAQFSSYNCCVLYAVNIRNGIFKLDEIGFFNTFQEMWVPKNWPTYQSLLYTSLAGLTLTISTTVAANATNEEARLGFLRMVSTYYWATLVNHFGFRLSLKVIRLPPGIENFNSINSTLTVFLKGSIDAIGEMYLISSDRVDKLGFILVGLEHKFHFIIRQPKKEYSWLALIRPLAPPLWISVLVMVLIVGTALFVVFRKAPNSGRILSLSSSLLIAFGFSCNQANLGFLKNTSIQIACLSGLFFFSAVNQFYVSNLYSILFTQEINNPFNSIEDFLEKKTYKMAIHPDSSIYATFQNAEEGILKRIWETFLKNDPGHVMNSSNLPKILNGVCSGKTAVFALPVQMTRYLSYCPLYAVPPGYFPNTLGLVVRKDFPYLRHFRALYLRAMEVGVSSYLRQKTVSNKIDGINTEFSTDPAPVTLVQVMFTFVILFGALFLSICILVVELMYYGFEKRRKPMRKKWR